MKTRSRFIWKIYIFLVLFALTFGYGDSVLASSPSTTMLTVVPSHVVIDVVIEGEGSVFIDENRITESTQIFIERHKEVRVCLLPEDNNRVGSVIWNGANIVDEVHEGEILVPTLENNAKLKVLFTVDSTMPNTEDTSFREIINFSILAIVSLATILMIVVRNIHYKK